MDGLRIGQVAKAGKVNLQTIRYYEREDLLPKPPRRSSGYRVFSRDAVDRVRFIKRAQTLGFSLKEIRELLSIKVDSRKNCSDVRNVVEAKIAHIEEKMRTLEAMRLVLRQIAATCRCSGPTDECPILESLGPDGP